jgi:kynurenine formamidase
MKMLTGCAGAATIALMSTLACNRPSSATVAEPQIIDLGHALSDASPTWTGTKLYSRTATADFAANGYAAGGFTTDEHFGTHVDAPAHFARGRWTVDQIPAERLMRPGVCIDVESRLRGNDDYRVTADDIREFERVHGAIPKDSVVFIRTGWDNRWDEPALYMNTQAGVKHFPGLSVDAAKMLAEERLVAGIGIDTASIDYGASQQFEAHRATQVMNVYHIENATRLAQLPPTGFTVIVAPVKIEGGSGAPARVFALVPAVAGVR